MYSILIVDDEILVRAGIKSCINWEANSFEEPIEAANALDALKIIETKKVDVVLADIKMPGMDGLEMINKIKDLNNYTEVIILSGHNDFEYTRKALKLGACDYLYKIDMFPQDILDAVSRAVGRINDRLGINTTIKELERKLDESLPWAKQAFIFELIDSKNVCIEELEGKFRDLNLNFNLFNITIILLRIKNKDEILNNMFNNDEYLLRFSIINILGEALINGYKAEVVCRDINEYITIISLPDVYDGKKAREYCLGAVYGMINLLKKYIKLDAAIGISKYFHNIVTIKTACDEAEKAADKSFFSGENEIAFYEDFIQKTDNTGLEIGDQISELYDMDPLDHVEKIKLIYNVIKTEKSLTIMDVKELSVNIMGIILKNAMKDKSIWETLYVSESGIYTKIYKMNNINDIETYITNIAVKVNEILIGRYRSEINEALGFIDKHIGDWNMSLDLVANHVNMSKSYFCRVFKQATGEGFVEYLTKVRVEKARILYKTTNMKVYQIARSVGYSNWRYFCKIYKKYTGTNLSTLKNA